MNITAETARELYDRGFTYRHYQAHPHRGMVFFYQGMEWIIGGSADAPPQLTDVIIADGLWLPSESHLMEWLSDNGFVYAIVNTDGFFDVTCRDSLTQTEYHAKTTTLEVALAAVIKKILKKHERPLDDNEKIYGEMEFD